ncbi:MAG: TM2 domain-containing protein [Bacteroidota bacterium]|nr:TM2 domain-containing protein [Bacteroidota bacterium]
MKKLLIVLVAVFAFAATASAASYKLDDAAIDQVIENATEISTADMMAEMGTTTMAGAQMRSGNNPAVVLVLNWFLGWVGLHRHYMGTRPFMWAIYLVTFGGIFGIVPFVDFIFEVVALIDDGGIDQFCGNTSFFMWA